MNTGQCWSVPQSTGRCDLGGYSQNHSSVVKTMVQVPEGSSQYNQPPMPCSCDSLDCQAKNKINKNKWGWAACEAEHLHCGDGESRASSHEPQRGPGAAGTLLAGRYFLISRCTSPRVYTSLNGASGDPAVHAGRAMGMPSALLAPCCRYHAVSPPLQVLSQLEACGLVETIHISAAGFPIR